MEVHNMQEIELGNESSYDKFPAEVKLGRDSYYLTRCGEGYRLLSRVCPHAGYLVEEENDELYCFMHGWSFDKSTGKCYNVPSAELMSYDVEVRDGVLVALIGEK